MKDYHTGDVKSAHGEWDKKFKFEICNNFQKYFFFQKPEMVVLWREVTVFYNPTVSTGQFLMHISYGNFFNK